MVGEPPRESRIAARWRDALGVCFAIITLSLAGCDATGGLPESGFVTRYVTGRETTRQSADAIADKDTERLRYGDEACRDLALTRASDAQESQSAELSSMDRQKIVDLTYDDCVKWRGK